jgi:hypothetical protein
VEQFERTPDEDNGGVARTLEERDEHGGIRTRGGLEAGGRQETVEAADHALERYRPAFAGGAPRPRGEAADDCGARTRDELSEALPAQRGRVRTRIRLS